MKRLEFVGDVITQPLSLLAIALGIADVLHHGIDQHIQVLLSEAASDVLVSHLRADYFLNEANIAASLVKMDTYVEALLRAAEHKRGIIVTNTLLNPIERVVGIEHLARVRLVAELNSRLFDVVESSPSIVIADLAGVIVHHGTINALNTQNDLVMRMPYTRKVVPYIVREYERVICERTVARKKVLLLDADNTLWGGVVGEDGVHGILVDDQFPGIVYQKFQKSLLDLRASGVLLALVTKNNEADVHEAFNDGRMPLKWGDFAAIRANWNPKSQSISEIAEELNVGLDSMVFIDDNPFEIEQVKTALPMVDCYKFDARNSHEALTLLPRIRDLGCWSITSEDAAKSEQYRQVNDRKNMETLATSVDEYIASLEIRVEVGLNRVAHYKRITQLINKTNQFNLTTRRYSETEILATMEAGFVFDFRVVDKFGDMGIVGVAIVRDGVIESFLMSCRALGRKVEHSMLAYVCNHFKSQTLRASFVKSAKNAMVADFYPSNGFALVAEFGDETSFELRCPRIGIAVKNLVEVA
jgi:FkbH-like protein